MREQQLKFKNLSESLYLNVYFSVKDHKFRVKAVMKNLKFEVSSSFGKKKTHLEENSQGFQIHHK